MIGLLESNLPDTRGFMKKTFYLFLLFLLFMGGCTEESRNKIFKQADNLLGKDLRVSYVADSGTIVKSWTVRDGKVTTHKDEQGGTSGYYYFWSCLLYTSDAADE